MIRTVWVALNLLVSTLVCGFAVIGAALVRVRGPGVYDWASRTWASWMVWAAGTPIYVEGLEHVERGEPQVIASNHVSWYDVFAIASIIPKRYRFVAKRELEFVPIFGTAWKAAGHISVDRGNRDRAIESLRRAGELIRSDASSVVIFPEGTRSGTDELLPFKKGAFMLALHTGVDIVPTAVLGTRRVMPKGAWRVRRAPIIVRFGEPIPTGSYSESTRDQLAAEVRRQIQELLEGPRATAVPRAD